MRLWLYPAIFITGSAVLILEVAATRAMAPYFGMTVFTVSSIIGVVLGALSVGYVVGGRLADKRPDETFFWGLIAASGLSVAWVVVLLGILLPFIGYRLNLITGPPIVSLLLLFVPNVILGMITPLAVKLLHRSWQEDPERVGRAAGEVYFFSTVGSIGGSFLTGFVFVPFFGVRTSLFGLSAVLFFLGLAGLLSQKKRAHVVTVVACAIAVGSLAFASISVQPEYEGTLYRDDGVYQEIVVREYEKEGRTMRELYLDGMPSGAAYLDSAELPHEYAQATVELARQLEFIPERILVLGGGSYGMPKALRAAFPESRIDAVEIEPGLLELATRYFGFVPDPLFRNFVTDGRRYIEMSEDTYDVIINDAYHSFYAIPTHMTTVEFFAAVDERLSPRGMFIGNFIGIPEGEGSELLAAEAATLSRVLSSRAYFRVKPNRERRPENILLAARKQGFLIPAADYLQIEESFLTRERPKYLTDDYAPVEFLLAKMAGKIR